MADRINIYDKVTQQIIHQLEKGVAPWAKPWNKVQGSPSLPINAKTGRAYSGVNVLMLWGTALGEGYSSNAWLTFRQALDMGGSVRKGEKGTMIVYADRFVPAAEKARAERDGDEANAVPFLRASHVFALEQIDGLPDHAFPDVGPIPVHVQDERAEAIIRGSGVDYRFGGDRAFYSPSHDFVQMPIPHSFKDFQDGRTVDYYRTAMHELTHSTGHVSRLGRKYGKRFGDTAYAREELVAEIGAAFLCAAIGIEPTLRHADYLANWLRVLKADNKAIFTAASHASKASEYLLARSESSPDPDKLPVPVPVEPVAAPVAVPEPVREPEPVAELPAPVEPVAAPVELPEGIVWPSPHKSPEEKAEWTRRFNIRQAAWKAGWAAFEAGKPRIAFHYLRSIPVADLGEARGQFGNGYDAAKAEAERERSALLATCPLFQFDYDPLPDYVPLPMGAEAQHRIVRDGVPCRVQHVPGRDKATRELKRRLADAVAGIREFEPVDGLAFTYVAPEGGIAAKEPARPVRYEPELCEGARRYYEGGYRLVVRGVPVRLARKPRRTGMAMARETYADVAA